MKKAIVSGGYWTGSSALLELFKGQKEIFLGGYESSLFSYGQLFELFEQTSDNLLVITNQELFDYYSKTSI